MRQTSWPQRTQQPGAAAAGQPQQHPPPPVCSAHPLAAPGSGPSPPPRREGAAAAARAPRWAGGPPAAAGREGKAQQAGRRLVTPAAVLNTGLHSRQPVMCSSTIASEHHPQWLACMSKAETMGRPSNRSGWLHTCERKGEEQAEGRWDASRGLGQVGQVAGMGRISGQVVAATVHTRNTSTPFPSAHPPTHPPCAAA